MSVLHAKFMTISSFFSGHTLTSREVWEGIPSWGGPICPITLGRRGSLMFNDKDAGAFMSGGAIRAVADVEKVFVDGRRRIHT